METAISQTYFFKKIVLMNVALTLLIVMLHSTPNLRFGLALTIDYPFIYIMSIVAQIGVPLFFFISGLLFYRTVSKYNIMEKMLKRVKSLLLPYLIWNTFFFLLILGMTHMPLIGSKMNMGELPIELRFILIGIIDSRLTPLWFVKDLMLFTLIAPIIYNMVRNIYIGLAMLTGCIIAFFYMNLDYTSPLNWLPMYLQGAIVGRHWYRDNSKLAVNSLNTVLKNHCQSIGLTVILAIVFLLLMTASIIKGEEWLKIMVLVSPLVIWILADTVLGNYIDQRFKVKWWMNYTFIIYCSHYFLLNCIQKLAGIFIEPNVVMLNCLYVITPLISVPLIIYVARFMSNYKNLYYCLSGGR